MKKLLLSFSILFIVSCGGGGGGGVPFALTLVAGIFTTNEDTSLSGSIGATANEVVTLSYSITTPPSNGTLTLASGGSFTYEPSANFNGSDSFAYSVTASEKTITKAGSASITITAVNDAPSISITQITPDDYTAYPLLISSTGLIEVALTLDDIDNENTELTLEASSTEGAVTLTYDSSASMTSATIDISQIALAGKVDITFSISDGVESVSDTMKFWYAKKQITEDDNNVYTLFGNNSDSLRKSNKVIIFDSLADNSILKAARGGLKEFVRFIGENDINQFIDKYFNILMIEYPVGSSSSLGVETGCDDRDENIYCFESDFVELVGTETDKYFTGVNDYTIVTGVDGRGTASPSDKISIQALLEAGSFYVNGLVLTMKHEFGHTFSDLGDEYTSDYNVSFECIDTTDLPEIDCGAVDSSANTSSQSTPDTVRWKHHFSDITNVNGYHDTTLTDGIGMYEGTYYGTEDTFRPSHESVMNGSTGNSYRSYFDTGISSKGVQWDEIGQEAFEVKALVNQGLHSIGAAFDDARDIILTHGLVISESDYSIDWYIDGVIDSSLENEPSIKLVRKETGFSSGAFRVRPLGNSKIIGSDDPDTFRDFYDGVFSGYPGLYYCSSFSIESYSDLDAYDEPLCRFTARVWTAEGSIFIVNEKTLEEAMDYNNINYLFEKSGLGSQFAISWENME
jgi:hypothetical protein